MTDDLAILCQSCALCCDGSLFGRASLDPDEVEPARTRRLQVVGSGSGIAQPCAALAAQASSLEGARMCSIYDERPRSCRRFTCRLYERHRREGGPLEARLAAVRRVRELVASLQALRLRPADFDAVGGHSSRPGSLASRIHAELQERLLEDFARA